MVYVMADEVLVPNHARECSHAFLMPAGECELCDVDWLLETRNSDNPDELRALRPDVVADCVR